MRVVAYQCLALIVIVLQAETCWSQHAGSKKCKRQLDKVKPGRTCRKLCKSDKDCKGEKKRCQCDNVCGMSCFNKKALCPDPGTLKNGKISGNVFIYDSVIEYVCDRGFVLDGQSTRVCQSNREWSGTKPTCAAGCQSPPRIGSSYSTAVGNIFKVGTIVNYKCRFGFTLVGNSSSQCLESLKWSLPSHLCLPISCGDPGNPLNGYIEGKDFTFGKWITYRCDKGYIIDDVRLVKRYCSTSGKWSGEPRTCSKLKCEPPIDPVNGYVQRSSSSLEFRTIITYRCHPGYRIVGNARGQCNEYGNWGTLPNCSVDVDCDFDSAPPNSFCGYTNIGAAQWGRHLLRQNTVSGSPSYVIRSPFAAAALRSPQFVSRKPHCFKFYYFIKTIRNRLSVTVKMTNGEEIFGRLWPKETRFQWLRQQLTINTNPQTGVIQYEIRVNDEQTEVDLDEFSLEMGPCDSNCPVGTCQNGGICVDRVETFSCLCTRFYKGRNCEIEILCQPLPSVKHGQVFYRPSRASLKPEAVASFTCDDGYQLAEGPHQAECTYDGVWSDSRLPVCKEILCPKVQSPQNGGRIMVTEEKDKIAIGSVVIFTCPINLYLSGGPEIGVCKRNGAWSYKSRPRCRRKTKRPRRTICPPGYQDFDTTCYRVITRRMNYDDASSFCAADDANLAIIRSREERDKISELMKQARFYFYGATNAGFKDMKWSNKEPFIKTAAETYRNIFKRDDITVNTRCGAMYKFTKSFTFSTRACSENFGFICQTFANNVHPIEVVAQANSSTPIDGIYRPMIGVTSMGSPVYHRQTTPKFHLYRLSRGWEIGAFDIRYTVPFEIGYILKTDSSAALPQDIEESWYGREVEGDQPRVDLRINVYDRWKTWGKWSRCSRTCGSGLRQRYRKCLQEGETAGFGDCPGNDTAISFCNTKKCIRTRWGKWSIWSNCTKPCGGGRTAKSRKCIRDPSGSENCIGRRVERKSCSTQKCVPETSKWQTLENPESEYKIFSLNETEAFPESFCNENGGSLAAVSSATVIDYLKNFLDDIHCKSKSANKEWRLQLRQEIQDALQIEYSGEESGDDISPQDDNSSISDAAYENCRYLYHSCDAGGLWISEDRCNNSASSRILCERETSPCNTNPCGVGGRCNDINKTHYECDCHAKFHGMNCQLEHDGCGLTLSNLPIRNITLLDQGHQPITAEDTFINTGEQVFIKCPQDGFFDRITCEGRNQWHPKSVYDFCQP